MQEDNQPPIQQSTSPVTKTQTQEVKPLQTPPPLQPIPPTSATEPEKPKSSKMLLIGVVLLLGAITAAGSYLFLQSQNGETPLPVSYDECKESEGSVIQESYPATCVTKDGNRFVQPLSEKEKENLKPTDTPKQEVPVIDNVNGYKTILLEIGTTSAQIQLPPEISSLGKLEKRSFTGGSGTQLCWHLFENTSGIVKTANAGGGPCDWNKFFMGAISHDYEAGRMTGFSDTTGYVEINGTYYIKGFEDFTPQTGIPSELVTEITNAENIRILVVERKNESLDWDGGGGTPREEMIAAIINLNDSEFPALSIGMELSNERTKTLFNQMLSTFKFIE